MLRLPLTPLACSPSMTVGIADDRAHVEGRDAEALTAVTERADGAGWQSGLRTLAGPPKGALSTFRREMANRTGGTSRFRWSGGASSTRRVR